jgi:hypothetical protein
MVDRHYSLNLKPWSVYVYAHADLAQKYSIGLLEIFVSRLCSQFTLRACSQASSQEEIFFPALGMNVSLDVKIGC